MNLLQPPLLNVLHHYLESSWATSPLLKESRDNWIEVNIFLHLKKGRRKSCHDVTIISWITDKMQSIWNIYLQKIKLKEDGKYPELDTEVEDTKETRRQNKYVRKHTRLGRHCLIWACWTHPCQLHAQDRQSGHNAAWDNTTMFLNLWFYGKNENVIIEKRLLQNVNQFMSNYRLKIKTRDECWVIGKKTQQMLASGLRTKDRGAHYRVRDKHFTMRWAQNKG